MFGLLLFVYENEMKEIIKKERNVEKFNESMFLFEFGSLQLFKLVKVFQEKNVTVF